MKILLTGATGYIAKRLIPNLLIENHTVFCCVRDKNRFDKNKYNNHQNLHVIEVDFLQKESLKNIPNDIDVCYYLIHSMSSSVKDFDHLEQTCAQNFVNKINESLCQQIIYLTGIQNDSILSKHLSSRKHVEDILKQSKVPVTAIRAGIIIGSGSASFEIIRDLVEKLPVMIAPKWVRTKCQPIAIRNVIEVLTKIILDPATYHNSFDIGGPDILSYKEMLEQYAQVRKLKRKIFVVPVLTPKLSSYWLNFITSTTIYLARNLVDSMSVEVVCKNNDLTHRLNINLITYKQAIQLSFDKIETNQVISSWKDALASGVLETNLSQYLQVPEESCFKDIRKFKCSNENESLNKIFSIGGVNGWYYGNKLWSLRGFLDTLVGGVGLRRGRKSETDLAPGDALDFWRVLIADRKSKRLLLFAEMKLPGEAWLEFKIDENGMFIQTATFRPLGIFGRLYWFLVYPFHGFIFKGMALYIAQNR